METLGLVLIGSAIGIITGLLPGIHVNTLAAIGFAVAPAAGPTGAVILLAIGTVHTIVNILPGTYLGVPEDDGVSMLPAHRMLLEGRGPDAVHISVAASLGALLLACLASAAYLPLMRAALPVLDMAAAAVLVVAMVGLWLLDGRGDWRRLVKAATVSLAAMAVGWLSSVAPLRPWVPVPASGLLPLLTGLFGAAGLTFAMAANRPIPCQNRRTRPRRFPGPMVAGTALACLTAVLPGLTSAVAASFVPGVRHHPGRAVAALSAVNTSHATFALVVWMGLGRIRTGLADAADAWHPTRWAGAWPEPTPSLLLGCVALAGALGALATLALDAALAPRLHRWRTRPVSAAALLFLVAVVGVLSGWAGLLTFGLALLVGRLPLHLGIRRVHLVAALLAPILLNAW